MAVHKFVPATCPSEGGKIKFPAPKNMENIINPMDIISAFDKCRILPPVFCRIAQTGGFHAVERCWFLLRMYFRLFAFNMTPFIIEQLPSAGNPDGEIFVYRERAKKKKRL